MNRITILLLSLVIVSALTAVVQDLPDIEISGPSPLKSTLEKRGELSSELYISDVVDSLQPVFPPIVPEAKPIITQRNRALNLSIGNHTFHANFLANKFILEPYSLFGSANYYTPKQKWSQFDGTIGILRQTDSQQCRIDAPVCPSSRIDAPVCSSLGLFVNSVRSKSSNIYKYQSDSAVNLMYNFNSVFGSPLPFEVNFDSAYHYYQDSRDTTDIESEMYYWNNRLRLKSNFISQYNLGCDASYIQKTPILSLEAMRKQSDDEEPFDFLKGLTVYATDKRIVPGIYLSKTFDKIAESTNLLLYQDSSLKTWDTYDLMLSQPWQKRQEKAIVSINPLNSHLVITNNSLRVKLRHIYLSADIGIQYFVDEPIYTASIVSNALPIARAEGILKSNLTLTGKISKDSLSFSQSCQIDKGWLSAHAYSALYYQPLISAESLVKYAWQDFALAGLLKQYYYTQSEDGKFLREAIDLGAKLEYSVRQEVTLYCQISNLLNRGKYVYKTLPTEPASIMLGAMFYF